MSRRLLEVEIEIDRNISTEIDRIASLQVVGNSLDETAKQFSILARKNLRQDLEKIKQTIATILQNEYQLKPLPVANKYARVIQWLDLRREK